MSAAIPVADMCSGTGELSAALRTAIRDATALTSLSDADPNSRTYLHDRFPTAAIYADCRDQSIPDAAIADHLNRIGYRAAVARGGAWEVGAPTAGNAVVARQATLMLARGLEQLDAIDRKELS